MESGKKIEIGSIVMRAYSWHCDEWGVVIASSPWADGIEYSEDPVYDGIENFTVLWPDGNLTVEMDDELLSQRNHEELVKKANKSNQQLDKDYKNIKT